MKSVILKIIVTLRHPNMWFHGQLAQKILNGLYQRCMAAWKTSWSRKIKLGWRKILWRTAKAKSETWSWKNEHTWSGFIWRPMEIRQIWRSGQNILHFWRLLSWPGKLTFSWIHYGWNVTKYNSNTLKFYPNPVF